MNVNDSSLSYEVGTTFFHQYATFLQAFYFEIKWQIVNNQFKRDNMNVT